MRAVPGGIFVTGHDPDYHAHARDGSAHGSRHLLRQAVGWVTFARPAPRVLLVTDVRDPGGDRADSRLGMGAAGIACEVADHGSGEPGVLDLQCVRFTDYDTVVVASDFGGWLRQDELDVLNARAAELLAYVNGGGGLVVLCECGGRPLTEARVYRVRSATASASCRSSSPAPAATSSTPAAPSRRSAAPWGSATRTSTATCHA